MSRILGNLSTAKSYELNHTQLLDARLLIATKNELYEENNWMYSYQHPVTGKTLTAYKISNGFPVSCAEDNHIYLYKGYSEIDKKYYFTEDSWEKVLTDSDGAEIPENTYDAYGSATTAETNDKAYADEKVATLYTKDEVDNLIQDAKGYADNNDTDTKYGIEYDSVTKKIHLIEGGSNTEIDASDFIKDGLLSSVAVDYDNNKLTFYWNTDAGIETTKIELSSIADIYTGAQGDRIKVTVDTDNTIGADLVKGSISKDYFDEGVKESLALADAAAVKTEVENELEKKVDKVEGYSLISNTEIERLSTVDNYNDDEVRGLISGNTQAIGAKVAQSDYDVKVKALEDAIATKQDVISAETYDAFGAATTAENNAKVYIDNQLATANLAQYTTEQEVKTIVDGVIASAADSDTYNSLTKLVDYIDTHGGEAAEMASAIDALEDQVKAIEEMPAYDITATQISNWDNEVGAKTLAESKITTAEVKTQIEAYGYAKITDLDNLVVTLAGDPQTILGNKTFTGEVDFSGARVKGLAIDPEDVDLAGYANQQWVEETFVKKADISNMEGAIINLSTRVGDIEAKPAMGITSDNIASWNGKTTLEEVKNQIEDYGYAKITDLDDLVVTLGGDPQEITGRKTFTGEIDFSGEVDFSEATVKGLAIDPADITLDGYATEAWVKGQGYVTALYENGILTLFSGTDTIGILPKNTTINGLLNAKADNIPFTTVAHVGSTYGALASGMNIKDMDIRTILAKMLNINADIDINNLSAPSNVIVNTKDHTITLTNNNSYDMNVIVSLDVILSDKNGVSSYDILTIADTDCSIVAGERKTFNLTLPSAGLFIQNWQTSSYARFFIDMLDNREYGPQASVTIE